MQNAIDDAILLSLKCVLLSIHPAWEGWSLQTNEWQSQQSSESCVCVHAAVIRRRF